MIEINLHHVALAGAGIVAGFVNTVAGGGSMLTLPALMLLGLPADVANGTNRLAIVCQAISGTIGFGKAGKLPTSDLARVLIPTMLGALIGAAGASIVPAAVLKHVLLATMVALAVATLAVPRLFSAPADGEPRWHGRRVAGYAGLFAAGLYGGFIQAGVGFLLLAALGGIVRYDLVRANALKIVCTVAFGAVALAVFAAAGKVAWVPAVLLAVSSVIGSLAGVRFALRSPPAVMRWIVFVCVVASCVAAYLKG